MTGVYTTHLLEWGPPGGWLAPPEGAPPTRLTVHLPASAPPHVGVRALLQWRGRTGPAGRRPTRGWTTLGCPARPVGWAQTGWAQGATLGGVRWHPLRRPRGYDWGGWRRAVRGSTGGGGWAPVVAGSTLLG